MWCSLSTDPFQQDAGRFVVRILRHQTALEGGGEDGATQALGAAFGLGDGGGEDVGAGEVAVDFGDDAWDLGFRR